jgi:outer membrane protein assembly factor BamA
MGLIRAALASASGVMKDQWKEYFYCEALPADVLAMKGQKKKGGGLASNKGDDNIISNGSIIAVADGQCMIIVEQGYIVDLCAEPGEYQYDASSEPSLLDGGKLGDNIKAVFGNIGKRFYFQFYPAQLNIVRIFNMDDAFYDVLETNPYLQRTYSNHFDLGLGGTLYYTTNSDLAPKNSYHYYRLNVDLSGNVLSAFNGVMKTGESGSHLIWGIPYSQYVRAEFQAGRTFVFGRKDGQAFSYRFLAGAGHAYGNSYVLPFEKVFFAGGASSLRGWQARSIGPGTTPMDDFFSIPSQNGDWKLEANLEYRFKTFWKIEGAIFADAGNVWEFNQWSTEESRFSWKSIAADWGIGLRVNLDFIVVRVDFGMQVHDPTSLDTNNGWLGPKDWFRKGNNAFHFGVGYPF